MNLDDETTAKQLHEILTHQEISLSLHTVLRWCEQLGWTFRGSAYCQLIRDVNKQKRLEWAIANLADCFIIHSDEACIQIETHRLCCYRKKGERPKPKRRPKHPVKVHVWAGIRMLGATSICMVTGVMDATLYVNILTQHLLPLTIQTNFYGIEHRFMQDNDPKHCSCIAQQFFVLTSGKPPRS